MKRASAKRQTVFLTAVNAVVRALGLTLRVLLSRSLGAELMGVAELAQSVHMLAITPLTSGLPMAVSRLTARAKPTDRALPLLSALWLSRRASLLLIPPLLLLSPLLARLVGDARALPSIWFTAPCVLILGYSAAYNGYCYGTEQSRVPALSELIEQLARLGLVWVALGTLARLTAPWAAAIPVAATMLSEIAGLIFALRATRLPEGEWRERRAWRAPVVRLAAPTTLSRLIQTLLRSLTAVMIPARLQRTGLVAAEATARLGMLNGMVMPILMLPCVFTSALTMIALPRLAKAEEEPREVRRILWLCFGACAPIGAASAAAIWLAAPVLANAVYRSAELTPLFRYGAPLALLFALSHVAGGATSALGLQKRGMYASAFTSAMTLALTAWLASRAELRLYGVVLAQGAGQIALIVWQLAILARWFGARKGPRREQGAGPVEAHSM